ncbi:MAG TPA: polysaccharide deacetylase family protein [Bryobacteraceae bacterium]|nr:polysaccharide deacetylase family protein [Bryobacteraceae bacterium]
MRAVTLLYHDLVEGGKYAESGFCSPDANIYKLEASLYEDHLRAIAKTFGCKATAADAALTTGWSGRPFFLTFDDGGSSALKLTAPLLERFGHVGHFFISTDFIGQPGFMKAPEIRELRARGHVIGSHSCSHPPRMSRCSAAEIEREWRDSVNTLADIISEPIHTASVPGGYYSHAVAAAAEKAGIAVLFNSEPTIRVRRIGNCLVTGRFSVQQGVTLDTVLAFAGARWTALARQSLYWNTKKALKAMGGDYWLKARKLLLARSAR